jgi:hypothetical protein
MTLAGWARCQHSAKDPHDTDTRELPFPHQQNPKQCEWVAGTAGDYHEAVLLRGQRLAVTGRSSAPYWLVRRSCVDTAGHFAYRLSARLTPLVCESPWFGSLPLPCPSPLHLASCCHFC